jgi:hypothetical protein
MAERTQSPETKRFSADQSSKQKSAFCELLYAVQEMEAFHLLFRRRLERRGRRCLEGAALMSCREPKRRAGGLAKVRLRMGAVAFAFESPGWAMTTVELGSQRLAGTQMHPSARRVAPDLTRTTSA